MRPDSTCPNCGGAKMPRAQQCRDCFVRKDPNSTCLTCGEAFWVKASRLGLTIFCSWECRQKAPRLADLTCEQCGAAFHAKPSKLARGGGKYCSRECMGKAKSGGNIPSICVECGERFFVQPAIAAKGGGKYCGQVCQVSARSVPAADRFWTKVNKDGPVPSYAPDLGPCWLWTASVKPHGYGQFAITEDQIRGAHQFSYTTVVGPVPDGLQLDHLCRVRHCVRPAHLEPVTGAENVRRAVEARKRLLESIA